jgi:hypothetical protein
MGNTIWRSNAGSINFPNEGLGNPVCTITGASQITAIVAEYKTQVARLWAAGAAAAADFYLRYSEDGGATWSAHGTYQGEALATVRKRQGFGQVYWVLVGKRSGEVYGFNPQGTTATFCEATGGGRIVFLRAEYGGHSQIWFLKGGKLLELKWESLYGSTNFADIAYYPGLEGLTCGCMLGGNPVVSDGSPGGIWRVTDEDIQWLGLPPQLASAFTKIAWLGANGGDVVALAEDADGATTLLVCSSPGKQGEQDLTPRTIAQKVGLAPVSPSPNPWETWQPILTVAKKPYAIHFGRLGNEGIGYSSASFLLCYDASHSYIYPFHMPRGGVIPVGGKYASGTYHRVMPTFAPMPSETGMFFGVEVGYDLPEAGSGDEAIQASYSPDNGSTWTEFSSSGINTPGRSSSTLLASTPVAFRTIDLRVSLTRGTTATKSPTVLWFTPIWFKRRALRYRWDVTIDVDEWVRSYGAYDDLLTSVASLYDKTTPITMTIGDLATTYNVIIERVIPHLAQAERPDVLGPLRLILQEAP